MDEKKIKRSLALSALCLVIFTVAIPCAVIFLPYIEPEFASVGLFESTSANLPVSVFEDGIRGVYIASVGNLNYPSEPGLDADSLDDELDDIIATVKSLGMNSIFFQVRPCADALYNSNIFPVSKYLSGEQGRPAHSGFDPLACLIEKAHREGISVHAWINPLRVSNGTQNTPEHDLSKLAKSNPAVKNPEWVICYEDGKMYFDPGYPGVRDLVAVGIAELLSCYELDGVMFDDYFYPYPVYGPDGKIAAFDDSESYKMYGNGESLDEWRRDNINTLIKLCYDTVKELSPDCLFGVAPFGIWANDNGSNGGSATSGLSAYDEIYCDALSWALGGYVDYLAPQIYWQFDSKAAPYATLVNWWKDALGDSDTVLLVSIGAYRYAEEGMREGEITAQLEYAARNGISGGILYGYEQLKNNLGGVTDEVTAVFAQSGG